ncbi:MULTISPECIES: DUF2092 domain-containing protein [Novosphingobium]|uniref:DUF2092 domain-containing protein n=1 Tax=Novosphingobium mangrovi (ex Hu et al. 2023) TaxID=2930094 RepID=A0ABT0A806_9SPHN|nr:MULTISPECIES: DUF2092 domain-containing protein [Novosphingobium]MCJ1959331.1 DUF2092 domain-containing protein [Novosphingobium mangrovi (ex Hu et al. 2023)]
MFKANLRHVALALACLAVGAPHMAGAQEDADAEVPDNPIDPAAMAALDEMSASLQQLASFTVTSEATSEIVLEAGQKIQFGAHVEVKVHRPDAFRVVSTADTQTREMFYDGKSFSLFAPKLNYYATFDAPPTIGQTIDKARTEFGLEVPLADLFIWGTDQTMRSRILGAMVIRPETIGSRTCMHYAFRQQRVDWQVWIDQGPRPLPCKLVITNRDDAAMPQYTAVLTWDTTTPVSAAELAFTPPAGATPIAISEVPEAEETAQ